MIPRGVPLGTLRSADRTFCAAGQPVGTLCKRPEIVRFVAINLLLKE
jgi:hypothetical protein